MRKNITRFIIVCILLFIFKGFLYRSLVNYTEIGKRKGHTITNEKLIDRIKKETINEELTLETIAEISQEITSKELYFVSRSLEANPNTSFKTKEANCIGYAAMCNAIGNYIIRQNKLQETYEFKHLVGKMHVLGYDIHELFSSPFFKNHDYNVIIHKKTGKKIYLDPSVYDYTWIDRVCSE
ncbi:hypothetical protein U8527_16005 [Kordia algicida OT-1]|uniref:Transglutaminase-like domain-containing protein n=1 Tax=Kordia algicida OT-1 TaxID=391587 RepID=A9E466_9FLAO|nr:hypothetical protein [Kordia algicida]EDP95325.1 hypothetical protein KAOT1_09641 [Kordia algicida OT-1]